MKKKIQKCPYQQRQFNDTSSVSTVNITNKEIELQQKTLSIRLSFVDTTHSGALEVKNKKKTVSLGKFIDNDKFLLE